jgi:hypothetical protein
MLEISWRDDRAGKVMVSRDMVTVSNAGVEALEALGDELRARTVALVESFGATPFSAFDHLILGRVAPSELQPLWSFPRFGDEPHEVELRPIGFPCVDRGPIGSGSAVWRGRELQLVQTATIKGMSYAVPQVWHAARLPPSAVGLLDSDIGLSPRLVGIWNEDSRPARLADDGAANSSEFPPEWDALCLVALPGDRVRAFDVWNPRNPVVSRSSPEARRKLHKLSGSTPDPLEIGDEITASAEMAASWVCRQVANRSVDLWRGLVERSPDFLTTVWQLAFDWDGIESAPLLMSWDDRSFDAFTDSAFSVLSPTGWERLSHRAAFDGYLPMPSAEWRIESRPALGRQTG